MNKFICLTLLLIVPMSISAKGVAQKLEVDFVRVDSGGYGYVNFKSVLTNTPATCTQPAYAKALAFDTNKAGGKAILSVALTAKASGKKIYAVGTGSCGLYKVMEQWSWGYIQ